MIFAQIIQRTYKTHFGKDLIEDIRSETSGNFENLLVALLTPIVDFYVKELHDAMAGIGTDEDVLIEVLCTMSNYEIHTIKHAYERREFILVTVFQDKFYQFNSRKNFHASKMS